MAIRQKNYMYKKYNLIAIFFIFSFWFILSQMNIVSKLFLPSPLEVLKKAIEMLQTYELLYHSGMTLFRAFVGFSIASIIGFVIGLSIASNKILYELFTPIIDFLRNIPPVAYIPLVILFLGIDEPARIFIVAFATVWPILINVSYGIGNIDPVLIASAKSIGARGHNLIFKVIFPASLPYLLAGMRISISIALIVTIVSEFLLVKSGLGFLLISAQRFFETETLFLSIITIGIIGFVLNYLFRMIEGKITWKQ